jgi:nitrogen fixation NifU-like protein
VTPELRRELLADHARRRSGRQDAPSAGSWREAALTSPTCGDAVTVRIQAEDRVVAAVEWQGMGCEVSQASASMLAELVPGIPLAEVPALVARVEQVVDGAPDAQADDLGDAAALAGVGRFPVRGRCATLAWRALLAAVDG